MIRSPLKYFIIFVNSPKTEAHKNSLNAGLRLALTLLMNEYEVYVLLTEEAIHLASKKAFNQTQETMDKFSAKQPNFDEMSTKKDNNFTSYELLDGIISFGGHVMACKSSLSLTGLKDNDIIESVDIVHLQDAVKLITECHQSLTF